jgi:patatin-like phospholipase/acyl hydrolase
MREIVKILSIDGGGIRGIVPALVLEELERKMGRPVSALFDLLAGTSTGGILALALTVPAADGRPRYSATDLVSLYENEGSRIFSRSWLHRLRALGNLDSGKYQSSGIDGVLKKYFGECRLSQAVTDVLITSYEIERRFPLFFRSSIARARHDYDFPMVEVARATSAAPTYFTPARISNWTTKESFSLIDGGVFANNPAACALVAAHTSFPARGYLVASLGTGALTRSIPYRRAKNWGLTQWAKPVLDVVFDGVSSTVDYQLQQVLPADRYFRFQTALDERVQGMDNVHPDNITALKCVGARLIREQERSLDQLCEQLTAFATSPRQTG